MTEYERPTVRPEGRFFGFHHLEFYCANAKQAADWACIRLGCKRVAYRGLETGSREYCSHAVKQGRMILVFTCALNPSESDVSRFISEHGDAVRDVGFWCDDAELIWKKATSRGAVSVSPPQKYTDKNGSVIMASLQTYGDCIHTLIQNVDYKGPFLPSYTTIPADDDVLLESLPDVGLEVIDHVVGNQYKGKMVKIAEWYEKMLDFHRFWSVDDKQVFTEYSALKSIVMTDFDRVIKMPLNEPAPAKRKSQIQEYLDYHGDSHRGAGAGVQHIAMRTKDILKSVKAMRARGMKFLRVPKTYYDDLRIRLASQDSIRVKEDLDVIEHLGILIDFDEKGYLLQIFTAIAQDRPTLFYEVIQRHNHEGFGAGNFKSLFEAIEREQDQRGNLGTDDVDADKGKSKL